MFFLDKKELPKNSSKVLRGIIVSGPKFIDETVPNL